jgi:hypothetical protein
MPIQIYNGNLIINKPMQFGFPAAPAPAGATGGTITNITGYKVHTFTSSGNFVISGGSLTVEYLSVAGGGGGSAGGGGAGGLLANTTPVTLTPGTYTITVGSGGTGSTNSTGQGANGTNSSIIGTGISVTSIGGGGGGASTPTDGYSGGSGGGGGHDDGSATAAGGLGTSGQGYAGASATGKTSNSAAGGGGGAGGLGGTTNTNNPAADNTNGGLGANSSISGTITGYAGGGASYPFESWAFRASEGGGGYYPSGSPGSYVATNARVNSGGGGFARGAGSPNGADGIVIIRYAA